MDIENLFLIGMITISTISGIIGLLKGNTDQVAKAEKNRQKALKKLQKKHQKTEKQYIKEAEQIKELNNNE